VTRFAFQVTLALFVSFVVIGVLRDNVTAVNSRIAEKFNPTPPPPASLPDLSPIAVALSIDAAAVGGPAPAFAAVAASACANPPGLPGRIGF
jgi:hypothetical protein